MLLLSMRALIDWLLLRWPKKRTTSIYNVVKKSHGIIGIAASAERNGSSCIGMKYFL